VNVLRGYPLSVPDGQGGVRQLETGCYSYFQEFEPVAMAGYSIYIYHITPEEADRVRRGIGLPGLRYE
ncbi:MAG: hypothetical protein ACREJB_18365, partial [Planctomycetaceae bacterium]